MGMSTRNLISEHEKEALKRHDVFLEFEEDLYNAKDEDIIDVYESYCAKHKDIGFKNNAAPQNMLKSEMERRIYLAKIAYYKRKD